MPSLNWIGREAVERHHTTVPFHMLREDPARSFGDADSRNLLVEADNLLALRTLLPYYAGQVKCIYIDPPYNTGKQTWAYNDNVDSPIIQEWLREALAGRQIDENDLSRHDKWLCMMYPRLILLHQLLHEQGVIWVSIDDTELANLMQLMDVVFFPSNRLGVVVWKNATDNNPTRVSVEHEYILCYAKDQRKVRPAWKEKEPLAKQRMLAKYYELKQAHADLTQVQGAFRRFIRDNSEDLQPLTHYNRIDENGPYTGSRKVHNPGREGYHFDAIHPQTGHPCVEPTRGYRFPETTYRRLLAEGKILFGRDHTQIIQMKEYLADYQGSLKSVIDLDGRTGANTLEAIFGNRTTFRNPKSVEIITSLLSFTTDSGDLVLDSFAGSGTTGHAVQQLNKQDGGNRRFILVEMEPAIAGPITAERLRRVSAGYGDTPGLGGGFRYCTLGPTLFDGDGRIRPEISFDELARFVFFRETGAPMPEREGRSPLLGIRNGLGVYLLYNGILKDKSADGGNALTRRALAQLPAHDGAKVIYGTSCRIGAERLLRESIAFRHIPLDLRVE